MEYIHILQVSLVPCTVISDQNRQWGHTESCFLNDSLGPILSALIWCIGYLLLSKIGDRLEDLCRSWWIRFSFLVETLPLILGNYSIIINGLHFCSTASAGGLGFGFFLHRIFKLSLYDANHLVLLLLNKNFGSSLSPTFPVSDQGKKRKLHT